ncbi:MAG: hypothetical protein ACRDSH_18910 [Pseudonocardiaceae bacterium]
MLADDAREIASAIEERLKTSACQGVTATVKANRMSPKSIPAGAGRPTFIEYFIRIDDDARSATLTLGQAAELRDEVEAGWSSDRLFEAIHALDAPIEHAP